MRQRTSPPAPPLPCWVPPYRPGPSHPPSASPPATASNRTPAPFTFPTPASLTTTRAKLFCRRHTHPGTWDATLREPRRHPKLVFCNCIFMKCFRVDPVCEKNVRGARPGHRHEHGCVMRAIPLAASQLTVQSCESYAEHVVIRRTRSPETHRPDPRPFSATIALSLAITAIHRHHCCSPRRYQASKLCWQRGQILQLTELHWGFKVAPLLLGARVQHQRQLSLGVTHRSKAISSESGFASVPPVHQQAQAKTWLDQCRGISDLVTLL